MTEVYAERYFRSWERDGRRQLSPKLALAFETYDEQRNGRLSALEWDDHHATYDEDYSFEYYDVEGAWTVDYGTQTVAALRERGIDVPPKAEIPVALEVTHHRRSAPDRVCPACGAESICSEHDVEGAFPGAEQGTAMRALLESDQGTHICTSCRRFWNMTTAEAVSTRDVGADLSEAM